MPPNEDNTSAWATRTLKYIGGLFFVTLFGLASWWWNSAVEHGTPRTEAMVDLTSQVLGWLSAISYGTSSLLALRPGEADYHWII